MLPGWICDGGIHASRATWARPSAIQWLTEMAPGSTSRSFTALTTTCRGADRPSASGPGQDRDPRSWLAVSRCSWPPMVAIRAGAESSSASIRPVRLPLRASRRRPAVVHPGVEIEATTSIVLGGPSTRSIEVERAEDSLCPLYNRPAPRGSAGAGEPGQTVNSVPQAEWVRIPPPPLAMSSETGATPLAAARTRTSSPSPDHHPEAGLRGGALAGRRPVSRRSDRGRPVRVTRVSEVRATTPPRSRRRRVRPAGSERLALADCPCRRVGLPNPGRNRIESGESCRDPGPSRPRVRQNALIVLIAARADP